MDIRHIVKPVLKIEHHMNLIYPTSLILKNDRKEDIYFLLKEKYEVMGKTGLELLEQGTRDADVPFSGGYIFHVWHFHHPWSHCGYLSLRSSADYTARLFNDAVSLWQECRRGEALYQLGRSLHLLQDIFVPQHAGITAFRGHGKLEDWLLKNWQPYKVTDGGYYTWEETFFGEQKKKRHYVCSHNPYDWIDHASHISIEWYDRYFSKWSYDDDTFQEFAPMLVAKVMRFSAGFINRFFTEAMNKK